jgi:hypothetical protein
MLPNSNLILTTPMPENLSISMSFEINPELKSIDLFHLFRDFNSFQIDKFNNNIDYNNFKKFIDKILNFINFNVPRKFNKVHQFTRSIRNYINAGIKLNYLYPTNFININININDLNNLNRNLNSNSSLQINSIKNYGTPPKNRKIRKIEFHTP